MRAAVILEMRSADIPRLLSGISIEGYLGTPSALRSPAFQVPMEIALVRMQYGTLDADWVPEYSIFIQPRLMSVRL
jgi:hypothetical protein